MSSADKFVIVANLRHAARNRETVTIGGGQFGPDELRQAADLIEAGAQVLAEPDTITTCPHCGSDDILIDAYVHANTGDVRTYDQMACGGCGYDGHQFVQTKKGEKS